MFLDPVTTWTGLEVLATDRGGPEDDEGTVEFRAGYRTPSGGGALHEVSRFVRRGGRWVYVDKQAR
jgi:SEC-C motif-containing protein